jgi:RHS repeat-associated protein
LGHPEDETGLVYMRARYYEPATGRFISEDPGRDGVNWYLYADGNPVNKVDYKGHDSESEWFALGAAFTALAVIYAALAPAAAGLLDIVYKVNISWQLAATLGAIASGVLATTMAFFAILAFAKALGGLPSEINRIIDLSVGLVAGSLLPQYASALQGLSRLGYIAGGIGLTAAIAAGTYMGITMAALLLIDSE